MLTVEDIIAYLQKSIAEDHLAGDKVGLRRTQMAAGALMAAAEVNHDKDMALRFRQLAAEAANRQEDLSDDD